jgi:hypothetical protein
MTEGIEQALEYDFFDMPVMPYTTLQDGAEVAIHVRDTETFEQFAVRGVVATDPAKLPSGEGSRLHTYGRLGVRIASNWWIEILEFQDEAALNTDHIVAQSLDIEQSLGSPETFRQSKFRKKAPEQGG